MNKMTEANQNASEYVLEMRDVTKLFPGVKALDRAQLKLRPGRVHALMGENGAGKSTLMNCMFGILKMDEGQILMDGVPVKIENAMDALNKGISMVHQELQPIPERTIGENIWLGRYPLKKKLGIPFVDEEKMYADTRELLKKVHMDFDPRKKVGELSVSQMQLVEIARAVSSRCRVLILDEPTSSLTKPEVEALFRIIRELKEEGAAIVYISHKMSEILEISDEVTVMRDGQYVGTWESKDLTTDFIISRMVGRELKNLYPERKTKPGEMVFEVEDFTSIDPRSFRNVSFSLHKGEILGIGGLVGAQRTELMEGLFGLRHHTKGRIRLHGKELEIRQPRDAIDQGIAMLTEDRLRSGIMGVLGVDDNIAIASLKKYLKYGLIDSGQINALVETNVKRMNIKTPTYQTPIRTLSGGNQQKALIGRWLALDPEVLILDEPTRGIDIGAKQEIYSIINELSEEGKSILLISGEMSELIGMSDRIMVMCEGRVTGFLEKEEVTQEKILSLATQFEKKAEPGG